MLKRMKCPADLEGSIKSSRLSTIYLTSQREYGAKNIGRSNDLGGQMVMQHRNMMLCEADLHGRVPGSPLETSLSIVGMGAHNPGLVEAGVGCGIETLGFCFSLCLSLSFM